MSAQLLALDATDQRCTLRGVRTLRCSMPLQVLGLLVGLTLRNPENAERAVEEGCVDVVIEVTSLNLNSHSSPNPSPNPKIRARAPGPGGKPFSFSSR